MSQPTPLAGHVEPDAPRLSEAARRWLRCGAEVLFMAGFFAGVILI
jgi:hypothetical protein